MHLVYAPVDANGKSRSMVSNNQKITACGAQYPQHERGASFVTLPEVFLIFEQDYAPETLLRKTQHLYDHFIQQEDGTIRIGCTLRVRLQANMMARNKRL